ncbi:MAG TPA: pantoate--beta-alanine ligase, partial [Longimicrobiales bacterium]|nr:pantoate--beta-alanine ligase [Longimicrobiales bacterium]
MIVARTRAELARGMAGLRSRPGRVALVPTMGYLHEGHLSLVDRAREEAGAVAVSIFVNPLQFGPSEDLDTYPRDEARDLDLLDSRGADLAFVPPAEEMYPDDEPVVTVDPGPMAEVLCGAWRPGHFRGVLTVVAKLFGLFRPDVGVFGRKDYQQGVLVRRMVRDLELGVEVVLAPVVREPDGLAMSSRNVYLSGEERGQAVELGRALHRAREAFAAGERDARRLEKRIRRHLEPYGLVELQYVE